LKSNFDSIFQTFDNFIFIFGTVNHISDYLNISEGSSHPK
jgi:hypothetical protein